MKIVEDEVQESVEAEKPTKSDIVKRVAEVNNFVVTDISLYKNIKPIDFIGQATVDSGIYYAEVTS